MGFFLFLFAAAATTAGLLVSAALIAAAVIVTARNARRRDRVWRAVGVGSLLAAIALVVVIQFLPLRPVSPGSDYDAVSFNWMLQGFAYGITPGLAAVAGAGLAWTRPRIVHPQSPPADR